MSNRGGQLGNKNATKNRPWADALNRILETHKPADQREKLNALACSVIAKAMEGDIPAIKEIADRLDGKAVQQTEITGADGESLFSSITIQLKRPE